MTMVKVGASFKRNISTIYASMFGEKHKKKHNNYKSTFCISFTVKKAIDRFKKCNGFNS